MCVTCYFCSQLWFSWSMHNWVLANIPLTGQYSIIRPIISTKLIIPPNSSVSKNRVLNPRQTDQRHFTRFELTGKVTKIWIQIVNQDRVWPYNWNPQLANHRIWLTTQTMTIYKVCRNSLLGLETIYIYPRVQN